MAPFGGLRTVREALIAAYFNDAIDDYEFMFLYDENMSRSSFPYWKFDRFDID